MTYRKIISVVNEHTASTVVARYAMSMAVGEKADLILYAAHQDDTDETKVRHTERHMDHLFAIAIDLDIKVSRISESGSISALLAKRVEAEAADLVFYPLTPGESYGSPLQKDAVHNLLRTVRTDIAIMRVVHMGKPHPQRILIPLGLTIGERRQRVLFIAALAKSFDSNATLFHLASGSASLDMPAEISLFRKELKLHHIAVEERSARGHVSKSIAVEAITRHNDLIVLGASERNTFRRLFFGNPAGDVMLKPPCNAILFRAGTKPQ